MENKYSKKIDDYIEKTDLNNDQKKLWKLFTAKATPEEDEAVYEAISESRDSLMLLTKHLKEKVVSMMRDTERA